MLTRERKAHIQAVLKRDGRVVAKQVAQDLGLSEDTIRRDLRDLAAEGLLQRVHGGALPSSPAILDFAARRSVSTSAKQAIGKAAAGLIRNGQVVFLDGGTTTVQLARSLPGNLVATIVTHSPSVAVELADHPSVVVELIGGRLFKHSVVSIGASALEGISKIRADVFVMGVTGLHPDAGFTTGDAEEAAVKRAISGQCGETVVLASGEKLGAVSPFVIGPLSEASTIVVEHEAEESKLRPFREAGLTVVRAEKTR